MFETMDIPEKPTLYPVIMPDEELKKKSSEIDLWKLIKPRYKPFYTREQFHLPVIMDIVEIVALLESFNYGE